jgi:hypothetical protein
MVVEKSLLSPCYLPPLPITECRRNRHCRNRLHLKNAPARTPNSLLIPGLNNGADANAVCRGTRNKPSDADGAGPVHTGVNMPRTLRTVFSNKFEGVSFHDTIPLLTPACRTDPRLTWQRCRWMGADRQIDLLEVSTGDLLKRPAMALPDWARLDTDLALKPDCSAGQAPCRGLYVTMAAHCASPSRSASPCRSTGVQDRRPSGRVRRPGLFVCTCKHIPIPESW